MIETNEELEFEVRYLRSEARIVGYFLNDIKKDILFEYGKDGIYSKIEDFLLRREERRSNTLK